MQYNKHTKGKYIHSVMSYYRDETDAFTMTCLLSYVYWSFESRADWAVSSLYHHDIRNQSVTRFSSGDLSKTSFHYMLGGKFYDLMYRK